jgi:hypothetical protein
MSIPTADELAELHKQAQRRIHSLTSARDLADSARRKIGESGNGDPVLSGLARLLLVAIEGAQEEAEANELRARNRARDAWAAKQVAADVAAANRAAELEDQRNRRRM